MTCLWQIDFLKHLISFGLLTFVCVISSFYSCNTFPSVCADQSSCLLQNSNLILFTLCFQENWTSPGFTSSKQILARQRYRSYSKDKRFVEMENSKDWQGKKVNVFLSEKKKVNPLHSLIFFAFEIALLFHLSFRVFHPKEARSRGIFFVAVK